MIEEIAKSGCGLGDFSLQKKYIILFYPFHSFAYRTSHRRAYIFLGLAFLYWLKMFKFAFG